MSLKQKLLMHLRPNWICTQQIRPILLNLKKASTKTRYTHACTWAVSYRIFDGNLIRLHALAMKIRSNSIYRQPVSALDASECVGTRQAGQGAGPRA